MILFLETLTSARYAPSSFYRAFLPSLYVIIFFLSFSVFSQKKESLKNYEKGVESLRLGKENQAFEHFEKAIKADETFGEPYIQLAKLYEKNRQFGFAISLYNQGIARELPPALHLSSLFSLGNLLLKKGDYATAQQHLSACKIQPDYDKFRQKGLVEGWLLSITFALEQQKNKSDSLKVKALPAPLNTFDAQYFPQLSPDGEQLVFTGYTQQTDDENIYISTLKNSTWSVPESISDQINSQRNEGTATLSADGRTLVFASCQDTRGLGSCDLYISFKKGDRWSKAENLGPQINSPAWESQPSLSADGRQIFFVSDRQGGFGGRDIYVSEKDSSGAWRMAYNVGKNINTRLDELSPFIHANGHTLFFASNGHIGMGGFDLFFSETENQNFLSPINLGYPINTHEDQSGIFVTADGRRGIFSQGNFNRKEDTKALLVQIELPPLVQKRFRRSFFVKGIVRDALSQKPISAALELVHLTNQKRVESYAADELTGQYLAVLPDTGQYGFFVEKKGYFFKSIPLYFSSKTSDLTFDIALMPIQVGKGEVLNNIFFDSNKADLRPESLAELGRVWDILVKNPQLNVEIIGHTDDVGKDIDNLLLSQKRATSVLTFLVQKGIAAQRLKASGMGETKPILPNDSDENRQKNRRIEWKVL
jgi:tetratricopeptide (TPR) repeat protein